MSKYAFLIFLLSGAIRGYSQEEGRQAVVSMGSLEKILDPSAGETASWYINDHCFIQGPDGKWHMFGITGMNAPEKWDESHFAHAVADSFTGVWTKLPFALTARPDLNETVLWAPYIIRQGDTYYMYYCGGHPDHGRYQINLATSKDLYKWVRYTGNPLFMDGYDARDPFLFHDLPNKRWILYYAATSKPEGGNHIVAARISHDLIHWSKDRYVVFRDTARGTWGGNTESPFVIQRGNRYYLFIGPGADYRTTIVYASNDLFNWDLNDKAAVLKTHAAEMIEVNGKWYISHCGLQQGGLYIAPFFWHDSIDVTNQKQ